MKRIGLQVMFLVALALTLAYWAGMSPQEVVAEADVAVPFLEGWTGSGHAEAEAEAFRHWDEDEEKVVPESCAKCHSTAGYLDFLGADGSEAGKVDQAVPAEENHGIECVACHNDVTIAKTSVVMPSGVEITGVGDEARCMECHQGRASKASIDGALEKAGVDADVVSEELGFINIHYFAAAATKYGTIAKGGYEYDGKMYDADFAHVDGFTSCIDCHDPHTLEVNVAECTACHTGVTTADDLKNVRMAGSLVDFDGDGDLEEGIASEIEGLQALLYQAIQAYGAEKSEKAIVYESHSYPYFFVDTNADGEAGEDEANYGNKYNAWTPRLLKAAYNYQLSLKDPGAYAHGGKYVIQLLSDSLEDLNAALTEPIASDNTHRIDHGHFAGSEEAFRHWDEDGEVPGRCSKCHSADGLPFFLEEGVVASQELSNGLKCSTCHDDLSTYSRYEVTSVTFPSGATVKTEEPEDSTICLNCHQGRQSKNDVDNATKGIEDDAVSDKLSFRNVHYFAAGATKYGSEVKGGYEYDGKEYFGLFKHVPNYAGCITCHSTHELEVKEEDCAMCHPQAKEGGVKAIRMTSPDYDGDGADEGVHGDVETLEATLYAAIQAYAKEATKPIVYNSHAYPYFFVDANADGNADEGDTERYNAWTPKLLRAAYNYQYVQKDPGGFAHNPKYIAQLLYDSLESLEAATDVMVRP